MEKKGNILMQKYEVGKLLGQGTFAKVYHGRNLKTGESVAIKVIDKDKVVKIGLMDQIKREISIMRLIRHPNVVQLHEVMASRTKIYFAMEYIKGGELFNKVAEGRLKENITRKYFQQLVAAVDFCHSRGVYHRDLKPENLLLDEDENLKVSDFGLSALLDSKGQDGLLHTTCGTPAYVAPEVIHKKGYDGEKVDVWSCGVILFVLLAGYLPFQDPNLAEMYKKIRKGEFKCPYWFTTDVRKLLSKILDPNPNTRITLMKVMENSWFKKGFKKIPSSNLIQQEMNSTTTTTTIQSYCISSTNEQQENRIMRVSSFNAFDIISLSPGFDLSGLFENEGNNNKSETRFTTQQTASTVITKLEEFGNSASFYVKKQDGMMKFEGCKEGRKGLLAIEAEIFEVTPSFHVVELKKSSGDTMEYRNFCDEGLKPSLKDIVWTWHGFKEPVKDTNY